MIGLAQQAVTDMKLVAVYQRQHAPDQCKVARESSGGGGGGGGGDDDDSFQNQVELLRTQVLIKFRPSVCFISHKIAKGIVKMILRFDPTALIVFNNKLVIYFSSYFKVPYRMLWECLKGFNQGSPEGKLLLWLTMQ